MKIIKFDEIDSTNNYLKENFQQFDDFTVIAADRQTRGRGRLGKSFFSPESGIYFSLLIKDKEKLNYLDRFTIISAVAVFSELKAYTDKKLSIKWVNDIYIENKKLCGILTESRIQKDNEISYGIIGIGINLYNPEDGFPEDIKDKAGCLFDKKPDSFLKEKIVKAICERIYMLLFKYNEEYIDIYRENSYLDNKNIKLIENGNEQDVRALYIDKDCRLIIENEKGVKKALYFGDISIEI